MDVRTAYYLGKAHEMCESGFDSDAWEMLEGHCPAAVELLDQEAANQGLTEIDKEDFGSVIYGLCVNEGLIDGSEDEEAGESTPEVQEEPEQEGAVAEEAEKSEG